VDKVSRKSVPLKVAGRQGYPFRVSFNSDQIDLLEAEAPTNLSCGGDPWAPASAQLNHGEAVAMRGFVDACEQGTVFTFAAVNAVVGQRQIRKRATGKRCFHLEEARVSLNAQPVGEAAWFDLQIGTSVAGEEINVSHASD
jgi:hypothetical protein